MAEMQVRMVSKINPDSPELDAACLKRGDVVCICPDDWPWSPIEYTDDRVIVFVPGATPDDLDGFLAPDPGDPDLNPLLRARCSYFDIDSWQTRGTPLLNLAQALALQVQKPALV